MELPISYDEALEEWERFEHYLVQARYSIRDPKTGAPVEDNFAKVISRVSAQFDNPVALLGFDRAPDLGNPLALDAHLPVFEDFAVVDVDQALAIEHGSGKSRCSQYKQCEKRGDPFHGCLQVCAPILFLAGVSRFGPRSCQSVIYT